MWKMSEHLALSHLKRQWPQHFLNHSTFPYSQFQILLYLWAWQGWQNWFCHQVEYSKFKKTCHSMQGSECYWHQWQPSTFVNPITLLEKHQGIYSQNLVIRLKKGFLHGQLWSYTNWIHFAGQLLWHMWTLVGQKVSRGLFVLLFKVIISFRIYGSTAIKCTVLHSCLLYHTCTI